MIYHIVNFLMLLLKKEQLYLILFYICTHTHTIMELHTRVHTYNPRSQQEDCDFKVNMGKISRQNITDRVGRNI